jgi:hypothetical protein
MTSPPASSHPAVGRTWRGPLTALGCGLALYNTDSKPARLTAIESLVDVRRFAAPPAPSRMALGEIAEGNHGAVVARLITETEPS